MKLKIKNLSCSFDRSLVLKNLNLSVKDREFVTILGPSGCGKSTLLNILAGIIQPDEGEIFVEDVKVKGLSTNFAYMPQQDLLMPWKTILENVILYGTINGDKKMAKEKALGSFQRFGLKGYENRYPRELSGGMRQRAAFLRTALCKADIMLLDEPFAALDVITKGQMQEWLKGLRQELNRTTILVTHDIDEAIYLSDRILILAGKPANFKKEIILPEGKRSREWLVGQAALYNEVYEYLEDEDVGIC